MAPAALLVASMAITAIGAVMTAQGQKKEAKAKADARNYNAQLQRNEATAARQVGEATAEQQERMARRRMATIRANVGGTGVQLEGSSLAVLLDSSRQEKLDELNIKYNAERQGQAFDAQAALSASNAINTKAAGKLAATTTLLKGAASIAGTASTGFASGGAFSP